MTSRTVQVVNNYGEPVRVKVIYLDGNTENIALDNNKMKVFEISSVGFFREPDACDLNITVYKDDILPNKLIIPADKYNYLVNINKGSKGFETSATKLQEFDL